jgi:hypothetical protein
MFRAISSTNRNQKAAQQFSQKQNVVVYYEDRHL